MDIGTDSPDPERSQQSHAGELADPNDFGELLSTSDVAKILGVNLNTVQRYFRQGVIPAHRLGSGKRARYYVFKSELLDALRKRPAAEEDAGEDRGD